MKYFFAQDESCHWYMIPVLLRERWERLNREETDEAEDIINTEFSQYRTGGGISDIEFIIL